MNGNMLQLLQDPANQYLIQQTLGQVTPKLARLRPLPYRSSS